MSFTKLDLLMMGDRDNLLSPDEFQKQLDDIVEEIDNLSGPQEPNMGPQVASGSRTLPIIHTPSGIGKPNSPMDMDPHLEIDLGGEGMVPNDAPSVAMQTQATTSQQALLTCPTEGQPAAQTDIAYSEFAHTKALSGMDPNSQGMNPITLDMLSNTQNMVSSSQDTVPVEMDMVLSGESLAKDMVPQTAEDPPAYAEVDPLLSSLSISTNHHHHSEGEDTIPFCSPKDQEQYVEDRDRDRSCEISIVKQASKQNVMEIVPQQLLKSAVSIEEQHLAQSTTVVLSEGQTEPVVEIEPKVANQPTQPVVLKEGRSKPAVKSVVISSSADEIAARRVQSMIQESKDRNLYDGLPKAKDQFPSLPDRLEIQLKRERKLNVEDPLFVEDLIYHLTPAANVWTRVGHKLFRLPFFNRDKTCKVDEANIAKHFDEQADGSYVLRPIANRFRLKHRDPVRRLYHVRNHFLTLYLNVPYSVLTAFGQNPEAEIAAAREKYLSQRQPEGSRPSLKRIERISSTSSVDTVKAKSPRQTEIVKPVNNKAMAPAPSKAIVPKPQKAMVPNPTKTMVSSSKAMVPTSAKGTTPTVDPTTSNDYSFSFDGLETVTKTNFSLYEQTIASLKTQLQHLLRLVPAVLE